MEKNIDKILEKLSSYNIFNYLFPGVVFCLVADRYLSIPLLQDSIVNGLFLYYFIGLVISRFGSVAIEPVLKKAGFVKFTAYHKNTQGVLNVEITAMSFVRKKLHYLAISMPYIGKGVQSSNIN